EVGDLPLHMQVKLLRAIQEKSVRPVGTQSEIRVDVRVLSATHRRLHELVKEGKFRQDLYYRLNVIELPVPSLRGRPEDIPLLAQALCERLAKVQGMAVPGIAKGALDALQAYPFPGNVRELENVLERALTLCDGNEITADDLQLQEEPQPSADMTHPDFSAQGSLEEYLEQVERGAIEQALARTNRNKTAAAKLLGITFRALRYKLEKLGIE
ncbi:MAG: sigma 54-interacting transcriptional regulator, partial [Acidiferrobacterales bacterium]